MTQGAGPDERKPKSEAMPDCGHLDEDPEALEDPVHCGDARHQHDRHVEEKRQPS